MILVLSKHLSLILQNIFILTVSIKHNIITKKIILNCGIFQQKLSHVNVEIHSFKCVTEFYRDCNIQRNNNSIIFMQTKHSLMKVFQVYII